MATGSATKQGVQKAFDYDQYVAKQLRTASRKVRLIEIARGVARWAFLSSLLVVIALVVDHWLFPLGTIGRWATFTFLVFVAPWKLIKNLVPLLFRKINPLYAAQHIEQNESNLNNSLINYWQLKESDAAVHPSIQKALATQAATDLTEQRVQEVSDPQAILRQVYMVLLFMLVFAVYLFVAPKNPLQTFQRVIAPWADISRPERIKITNVIPGDTDVFYDSRITVTATVKGVRTAETVNLVFRSIDGTIGNRVIQMQADVSADKYSAVLPNESEDGIQTDLEYWIQVGDAKSGNYEIRVLPAPSIRIESLSYEYPAYTKLEPRTVKDQYTIEGIEGTIVSINATINQPGKSASLELLNDSERVVEQLPLSITDLAASGTHRLRLTQDRSQVLYTKYRLHFTNAEGESNPNVIESPINVIRDLDPEIEIVSPDEREIEIPLNGAALIKYRAIDPDFMISKAEMVISNGKKELDRRNLAPNGINENGPLISSSYFQPKKLGLKPGDSITIIGVVEDNRHLGDKPAPNTASTDVITIKIAEEDPNLPEESEPESEVNQESPGSENGETGNSGEQSEDGAQQGNGVGEDSEMGDEEGMDDGGTGNMSGGSEEGESEPNDDPGNGNEGESSDSDDNNKSQGDNQGNDSNSEGGENSNKDPMAGDTGEAGDESSEPGEPMEGEVSEESESDPHDGDTFQKVLDYLKEKQRQQNGSDSEGQDPSGSDQENSGSDSESQQNQSDSQNTTSENQDSAGQKGNPSSQNEKPTNMADTPGDDSEMAGDGDKSDKDGKKPKNGNDSEGEKGEGEKGENSEKGNPQDGSDANKPSDMGEKKDPSGDGNKEMNPEDGGMENAAQGGGDSKDPEDKSENMGNESEAADPENMGDDPTEGQSKSQNSNADSAMGQGGNSASNDNSSQSNNMNQSSESVESGSPTTQDTQADSNSGGSASPGDSPGTNAGAQAQKDEIGLPEEIENNAEERLDYAKQATSLVLEYLKDQQDNPDKELLEELNLSADDLREMIRRYDELMKKAAESDEAQHELEETLRSLGLKPRKIYRVDGADSPKVRLSNTANQGDLRGLPPKLLQQYKAFKTGTAISKD